MTVRLPLDDWWDTVCYQPAPMPGYKRKWLRCEAHGRVMCHDYVPYSLSNPIYVTPCGCDFRRARFERVVFTVRAA